MDHEARGKRQPVGLVDRKNESANKLEGRGRERGSRKGNKIKKIKKPRATGGEGEKGNKEK